MNRFQYPVLLTPADEGGYVVTCRDLPELVTQGESIDDALEQAADAMDEVFATYLTDGLDLPPPSKARRREQSGRAAGRGRSQGSAVRRHAPGRHQQGAACQAARRRREGSPPAVGPALRIQAAANCQGHQPPGTAPGHRPRACLIRRRPLYRRGNGAASASTVSATTVGPGGFGCPVDSCRSRPRSTLSSELDRSAPRRRPRLLRSGLSSRGRSSVEEAMGRAPRRGINR